MKPILYFKSYRSFVYMGLGFNDCCLDQLPGCILRTVCFLYFSIWSFKDASRQIALT